MPFAEENPLPRVLVVDDERQIADTLSVILTNSGFDAVAAYGGAEAVEKGRYWHPDLLLSDVVMPETDGIETADRILRIVPQCKVLLFSGQEAFLDLPYETLNKPIPPETLLLRIRDILNGSRVDLPS